MKFSHNILHTYSFILCIKTKKSKICENWVADMVVGSLKWPVTGHGQSYPLLRQKWLLEAYVDIWRPGTFNVFFNWCDVNSIMSSLGCWYWTAVQQYGTRPHQTEEQIGYSDKVAKFVHVYKHLRGRKMTTLAETSEGGEKPQKLYNFVGETL